MSFILGSHYVISLGRWSSEICEESEMGRKFEKVERPCGSAPCPFSVFIHLSIPYFSTMIWLHRSVWPPPHRSCLSHPFCPCHTVALCRWWWVLKPATSTAWRTHKDIFLAPDRKMCSNVHGLEHLFATCWKKKKHWDTSASSSCVAQHYTRWYIKSQWLAADMQWNGKQAPPNAPYSGTHDQTTMHCKNLSRTTPSPCDWTAKSHHMCKTWQLYLKLVVLSANQIEASSLSSMLQRETRIVHSMGY